MVELITLIEILAFVAVAWGWLAFGALVVAGALTANLVVRRLALRWRRA